MSWLDFANHFLSNQRLRAWSRINRTFFGNGVFGEKVGFECFGLFLFCFCLVWGGKSHRRIGFWLAIKGRGPLQVVVSFVFLFACDNSNIVWSEDLSVYFFCFLPIFDQGFSFFFCFLPIFDRELFFFFCFPLIFARELSFSFVFFRSLLWNFLLLFSLFSSKGKDGHSHPGSRFMVSLDFGSRLVEQLDMIYVRVLVWSAVQDKGMSHIISMTHMQQWWFRNFMQNLSCMHPCGHSSIKFSWLCDTRAQDSFSLFKSTQCFQNMLFYQFMHSSESIMGIRENFHSIHPSGAYTFFFKNLVFWMASSFPFKSMLAF